MKPLLGNAAANSPTRHVREADANLLNLLPNPRRTFPLIIQPRSIRHLFLFRAQGLNVGIDVYRHVFAAFTYKMNYNVIHGAYKMPANALVQTRIDSAIKEEASIVLQAIGLTVSDAVRLMLTRVARDKALPFEPLTPTKQPLPHA